MDWNGNYKVPKQDVNVQLNSLEQRVNSLEQRVNSLEQRVSSLEQYKQSSKNGKRKSNEDNEVKKICEEALTEIFGDRKIKEVLDRYDDLDEKMGLLEAKILKDDNKFTGNIEKNGKELQEAIKGDYENVKMDIFNLAYQLEGDEHKYACIRYLWKCFLGEKNSIPQEWEVFFEGLQINESFKLKNSLDVDSVQKIYQDISNKVNSMLKRDSTIEFDWEEENDQIVITPGVKIKGKVLVEAQKMFKEDFGGCV